MMNELQQWEGRVETREDEMAAAPVRGLAATLDHADSDFGPHAALPPLWHWLYFLPMHRQGEIGADGHPVRGGFLPPVPLPRRMWAGGRLQWHAPLCVGEPAQRFSRIESVRHKSGRSGDLVFVSVTHELTQQQRLCLTERQDLVYRAAPRPGDPASAPMRPPAEPAWSRQVVPDEVLLFRYSALTFNGHRIHYDRDYATQVEGYPGLVVHGPLLATMLADMARREQPLSTLASFEFKAIRPTFDLEPFHIHGRPTGDGQTVELWVADHEGSLTMQAAATFV